MKEYIRKCEEEYGSLRKEIVSAPTKNHTLHYPGLDTSPLLDVDFWKDVNQLLVLANGSSLLADLTSPSLYHPYHNLPSNQEKIISELPLKHLAI